MKQLLTLALLFFICTAIGQKTTADIKKDTIIYSNGYFFATDSINFSRFNIKTFDEFTPKYTISDGFSFWYKNKEYKVSELVEMLEWFRFFKKSMINIAEPNKPIKHD